MTTSISSAEEHNEQYEAACKLIIPHIKLHGREPSISCDAREKIAAAIQMLEAVTSYNPRTGLRSGSKVRATSHSDAITPLPPNSGVRLSFSRAMLMWRENTQWHAYTPVHPKKQCAPHSMRSFSGHTTLVCWRIWLSRCCSTRTWQRQDRPLRHQSRLILATRYRSTCGIL